VDNSILVHQKANKMTLDEYDLYILETV